MAACDLEPFPREVPMKRVAHIGPSFPSSPPSFSPRSPEFSRDSCPCIILLVFSEMVVEMVEL